MTTDQAAQQIKDAPQYQPHPRPELIGITDDWHRRGVFGLDRLVLQLPVGDPVVHAEEAGRGRASIRVARAELVRWCREVLAELGEDTGQPDLPEWRPVTDGEGKRPWFLARYSGDDDMRVPQGQRYYYGKASGNLVRYQSRGGAQHAADALNASEGWTREQAITPITENWMHCTVCGTSWDWLPLDRCPETERLHPLTRVKQAS